MSALRRRRRGTVPLVQVAEGGPDRWGRLASEPDDTRPRPRVAGRPPTFCGRRRSLAVPDLDPAGAGPVPDAAPRSRTQVARGGLRGLGRPRVRRATPSRPPKPGPQPPTRPGVRRAAGGAGSPPARSRVAVEGAGRRVGGALNPGSRPESAPRADGARQARRRPAPPRRPPPRAPGVDVVRRPGPRPVADGPLALAAEGEPGALARQAVPDVRAAGRGRGCGARGAGLGPLAVGTRHSAAGAGRLSRPRMDSRGHRAWASPPRVGPSAHVRAGKGCA